MMRVPKQVQKMGKGITGKKKMGKIQRERGGKKPADMGDERRETEKVSGV